MSKPTIYMTVGLVASGKSTWAEKNKDKLNAVIHSSDKIRAELLGNINDQTQNDKVFRILHKRIKDDLRAGKNVIMDQTGLNRRRRIHFLNNELKGIECEKICILFTTPWEQCLVNNFARDRQVPEDVLARMYRNFETPWFSDGFDDIQIVWQKYISYDIDFEMNSWKKTSQENPHHRLSIGDHMLTACEYMKNKTDDERLIASALLHDCGKIDTQQWNEEKGHCTYYQHHCVGSYKALFYLKNMYPEWSDKDILYVSLLINLHMRPLLAYKNSDKAKENDRRLFGDEMIRDLMLLNECDLAAH